MIAGRDIDPQKLAELLRQIQPDLYRFPAVDPEALQAAVNQLT